MLLHKWISAFIPEGPTENSKKIHKPAKAQTAKGQGIDDAGTDFTNVEPVNAKPAQSQTEEKGCPSAFKGIGLFLRDCMAGSGVFHAGTGSRGI